ncbi:PAS domain-containing protein [Leeuwenhoekiella aestuarii]|uniref:Oxygen sensor histidine kinase NreB n=1 Tax=Leeuwenhoekiella aestuarii TaxID=2249426 RepID=A0A4Q0NTE8_9FLAO|nr:ATP-binding protein [Leeuwenhoekiella aestuarii]RXG14282.1 PAS domain-containing protein [Leeuwenhoekiella aestuarii]RXG19031.1 PAS domain-containing protein [Leeuwenhoekiella aestuarii]
MPGIDQKTFKKLRRLYIIALSLIALSVIVSQMLVRKFLDSQATDSTVVNIAGRQRMLSQKLTKEAFQLSQAKQPEIIQPLQSGLRTTRELWHSSHLALQSGSDSLNIPNANSEQVKALFKRLNPIFDSIYNASAVVINTTKAKDSISQTSFENAMQTIQTHEGSFLNLMDEIVNQYNQEAEAKIERLRSFELLLVFITLFLLFLEFIFIFWPTAKAVKKVMADLIITEQKSKKMAINADELSQSKEKLLWESNAINQAMDKALLFVRLDQTGSLLHAGEKFKNLFNQSFISGNTKLSEVLSTNAVEQQFIDQILQEYRKTGWQGEIKATTPKGRNLWLEMSLLPFKRGDEQTELLIIFLDITKRKEAHDEIERLNKANFEERISHQKMVSRQIIENQEQEQNRIAQDLHDGIGQMLTGLKFNLESIDLDDLEKSKKKIDNLKSLSLDIIKGIRTATFNLTPPELTDHGLVPALAKLAKELSNLTGSAIQLLNKTDFNSRLDILVEINAYRITQEAINNAIKYAQSSYIVISVAHSKDVLSISIDDDGKGFSIEELQAERRGDGGMGMTFMRERTHYINGRLFVNSELGKGTRITLNIPIN